MVLKSGLVLRDTFAPLLRLYCRFCDGIEIAEHFATCGNPLDVHRGIRSDLVQSLRLLRRVTLEVDSATIVAVMRAVRIQLAVLDLIESASPYLK